MLFFFQFLFMLECHILIILMHVGTVELQWLKRLWDHENLFETGVVRAIEGLL